MLNAEGERASTMLIAKGNAESKLLESRAEAQSMQAIRSGTKRTIFRCINVTLMVVIEGNEIRAVDYLVAVQYLDTMTNITSGNKPSGVILIPVPAFQEIKQVMQLNGVAA